MHAPATGKSGGIVLSVEEARRAGHIPDISAWPDLSADEAARRAQILDDIARRVAATGPRHATPSPKRGQLFMPFAALKGYDEVVAQAQRAATEAAADNDAEGVGASAE